MHPLLARQLKRLGLNSEQPPAVASLWTDLLKRVDQSYVEADQGHALLERSLALSSAEMQDLYGQLKRTSDAQLAQERNKLQAVIQALGKGLCVVDPQWKIQMVNHQAELMFGKEAHALVGHPVYQIISPGPEECRDECLIADASVPPLVSGQPYGTNDGLLMTANGHLLPISLVVTPMMLDGKVVGAVLLFQDITQQKQVQQEQHQTEWLLRRIQIGLSELAQNPQIYGGDLTEGFRAITRMAAACLRAERVSIWLFTQDRSAIQCVDLFQLSLQEHSHGLALAAIDYPRYFQELNAERIVAADDAQRDLRTAELSKNYLAPLDITSLLDVPIRSGGRMVGVLCHEHCGPQRHWMLEEQHFATAVANTVTLALEAADRRKAEQALRTSEGRLATTVKGTNIGIWDWDLTSNGVYLSPEWKRQLGYEDHELVNSFEEWRRLLHPEDQDRAWGAIENFLLTRPTQFELEHRLRHKDGSYRWILARGTAVRSEADVPTRIVGINIDVTDRRESEEALRHAKEAAEAATQAKSQFLANMSHEIRTPMNGVLGLAELLLQCTLGEKERRLTESIHRSGTALLAIINDILDFSKIEAGKLRLETIPFEVRRTIQETVDLSGPDAQKKQLKLSLHIDDGVPDFLLGDPMRLRQILVNLVGNAVKFTEHGFIEVSVTLESLKEEECGLMVTVRDTGIGLSPEVETHIFDAFSQADSSTTRRYGGTGLGLAIVKQLVTLMGGQIDHQSRLGEGSTFRFTAYFKQVHAADRPWSSDSSATDRESTPFDPLPIGSTQVRILLVEDNPVNREVACGMLAKFNCRIDIAENGREAVVSAAAAQYALVLMDCQMPEMDGLTATKLIREHEAQHHEKGKAAHRVPIIALTAHAMQGDRELCLTSGMDDYLPKPYTLSQLEYILARWIPIRPTVAVDGSPGASHTGSEQQEASSQIRTCDVQINEGTTLDQSALAAIRALQRPGQPDLFARVLSQYVDTSRQIVEQIRRAVFSRDAAELRMAAHRLKSSSAQLGASAVAVDCRELELMGARQELGRAEDVLNKLERHHAASCTAIQEELAKVRSAA
ncbi:MAG: PAS domain S-box protein [Nitrospira sp.]|nr:PAS domain S-box protein [Nitrospira sp.]